VAGAIAGIAVLAVVVAAFGPALLAVPLQPLRLIIGGLLLIFGLQWLRKAILRASGFKALHDEDKIFQTELAAAQAAPAVRKSIIGDWYAFTVSFKGVLLEGLEVAFIVLTFGSNQGAIGLASVAAAVAIVLVVGAGFAVRAPLARVPENTMKFAVGVMLTGFGMFWGVEGAGGAGSWPGNDTALLVIIPAVAVLALGLTAFLRRRYAATALTEVTAS
jgi:uncharacterized membrane protein